MAHELQDNSAHNRPEWTWFRLSVIHWLNIKQRISAESNVELLGSKKNDETGTAREKIRPLPLLILSNTIEQWYNDVGEVHVMNWLYTLSMRSWRLYCFSFCVTGFCSTAFQLATSTMTIHSVWLDKRQLTYAKFLNLDDARLYYVISLYDGPTAPGIRSFYCATW